MDNDDTAWFPVYIIEQYGYDEERGVIVRPPGFAKVAFRSLKVNLGYNNGTGTGLVAVLRVVIGNRYTSTRIKTCGGNPMSSVFGVLSTTLTGGIMEFLWGNPFGFKEAADNEQRLRDRNSSDPEQGPRKEKGDFYILLGSVIGIVAGGTIGVVIGGNLTGMGGIALGLILGIILGGLIGTSIGNYAKNRKSNKLI